jgi:RHS repeat-associated protein
MQRTIYRLLFFCFLLGSYNTVKAIDEKYAAPELRGNQLATGSTSMVMDTVYFNPDLKPIQTTYFVKNLITFQLDESYRKVLPDEFNVTVYFKVHYTVDNNGTPVTGVEEELSLNIEYTKYTTYKGKAALFAPDWWYKAEIEIDSIKAGEGYTLSDFQDALVLTNEILINREYNFSCTNNAIHNIYTNNTPVSTKGELNVYWFPQRAADEYDLEWTYIDELAVTNYYKTGTTQFDPKKLFANNATRVSVRKETYNIPLLYEAAGRLFYRVRAVQVKREGQRIESVWSSDYTSGLGAYSFIGLDSTLNWQASTSFAEDGKRKSVVQYFDGSLKSRQTVTKDNTTDTTIVAETFYDYQGRPVIQVMPTPSLSSIIKFTPRFNQLNGAEYIKDEYDGLLKDSCYCKTGAPAMDSDSGAANYYSPQNPLVASGYHKYIPDANGYVFAETRYTPDNTGRVTIQSGVGETFQIGKGHETNYTYNAADQEELDALFGTEVGNAKHYFKNTVRDANGQVSISYVDMHGRTIATALAGMPPVSFDTLTSNRSYYITKKLIDSNSNVVKGTVIESSKGLVVTKAGPHQFIYSLLPDSISIKDCDSNTICYDCIYDLRITITDECNNTTMTNGVPVVVNRTNYKIDTACNALSPFPALDTTVYLREGSYLVTKTLTVNRQAMDFYRDSIYLVHNTCRTLEQIIQEQKTLLASVMQCEVADSILTLDEAIEQQMLADVTPPSGQYANPDNVDYYSVFWSTTLMQAGYQRQEGDYTDENGQKEIPEPGEMDQATFVAAFKSSWAETLLPLHPEYPKLKKLKEFATSNTWDQQFGNTATYQEAVAKGYLNPGNFTTHPSGTIFAHNATYKDPFFTTYITEGKVNNLYKKHMQDSLLVKVLDANNYEISVWSLATILANCSNGDAPCVDQYKALNDAFTVGSGCTGDQDMAWKFFREMYLQEKREIINEILRREQQDGRPDFDITDLANNHALNFYDPAGMPASDMPATEQAARDSLQKYINDNCTAYVTQWLEDLGPCNYDSTDRAWIMPQLIQVCREGGDEDHFFGASTVKPSSTNTYKSFEEVLKAYSVISGKPYNTTCNVYLISAPLPYDQQPVYTNKPVYQKPDSCECATISSLYQQYQYIGKDTSFADYLYRTTGTQMTPGALDTLRLACNGQINCNFLSAPVYLPPVLQCGVKNVCVGCKMFDTLYKQYVAQFPDALPATDNGDSLQTEKNKLFERFMNVKLGFGKQTSEYLAFIDQCKINSTDTASPYCEDYTHWLSDYKKYGGIPHLDASGSDTTHWKVDFGGWNYTAGVPLGEVIKNGVMSLPGYYADSITNRTSMGFDYVNDTLCLDSAGFTFETRIKLPDSLIKSNVYGASWWFWLYTDAMPGNMLMAISPVDGKGVAVCTHHSDPLQACANENIPGRHLNDWRVVKFQFRGRAFKYYIDDTLVAQRTLDVPMTKLYKWSFQPFSMKAQVDYIRMYDTSGTMLYNENFDDPHNLAGFDDKQRCLPCGTRFANYFNQRNGTNLSYASIDSLYFHSCGISLGMCDETPVLCGKTEPVFLPDTWKPRTACDDSTLFATSTGVLLHEAYRDSLIGSFNDRYLAKCLSARYNENFTVYQPINEFHYTLYYYDQAGNLLKTVAPEGVDISKFAWARAWSDSVTIARRNKQYLTPAHAMPTQYRYNTLNQVVAQQSPDGGQSEFWYDRLGRLAISRNARQKATSSTEDNRLYSYTEYDSLGRITEVGQMSNTGANGAMTDVVSRNQPLLQNWLAALTSRRGQITNTVYDLPYPGFDGISDTRLIISQRNLRNRVSYTTLTDTGSNNIISHGAFYTYDILGNVDHLLQDYGSAGFPTSANVMNKNGNQWKKISYQYDLISGKVNMVMYQHEWMDGFFHRYSYDAENRLTLVETSRDSLVWEKDARYDYYRHGPLARVTLGEQQVQGLDYAYTLQGWLKGMNSTGGTDSFDMGADAHAGSLNQYVAKDALGLTLNYFDNDYTAINGMPFPGYSGFIPSSAYRPLYNGNISSSSVYQKKFDYSSSPGGPLIFYNYKYDQLNRLTGQDAYRGLYNTSSGLWDSLQTMGENLKERIAYDANGNIMKYLRNSIDPTQVRMDSLHYEYYANTNRLRRIRDSVPANGFVDPNNRIIDIDGQADNNYGYDAIGNLVRDDAEHITGIKWNVYGKIQEITKNVSGAITTIKYTYDASGNRISQTVISPSDDPMYTWYVRDAQGNIMSTYKAKGNYSTLDSLILMQSEKFLYGSSRLGLVTVDDADIDNNGPGSMQYYYGTKGYDRGYKQYELTNHLGNVLATISDRKFGISSGGSSLISYYEPDIVTAQDYYPFGMLSRVSLPNSGKTYKFGFNGKMNDDDVKGLGNQQDYGFRIYDPRIGKFLSVDPLTKTYPWYTPYQFAGNKPIWATDIDGLEENTSSTSVYKPPVLAKPAFLGTITIIDARSKSAHKTFEGNFQQLGKADPTKFSLALVNSVVGNNFGTGESRLNITITGIRSQTFKTWKGSDVKYFTQFSYSFTNSVFTENGTFEVNTGTIQASARIWDPLVFILVNKAMSSVLLDQTANVFTRKNIEIVEKHLESFGPKVENMTMMQRLKSIYRGELKPTEIERNFMAHELREQELMKKGMKYEEAHEQVLKEQNMFHREYDKKLYTKEALERGNRQFEAEETRKQ